MIKLHSVEQPQTELLHVRLLLISQSRHLELVFLLSHMVTEDRGWEDDRWV